MERKKILGYLVAIGIFTGLLVGCGDAPTASSPEDRAAALKELVDEGVEGEILKTLVASLSDEETDVRDVAIEGLEEADDTVPFGPIAGVALRDKSPELRMDAIELLVKVDGKRAQVFLKQAVTDPDPRVSHLATELQEELEAEEEEEEEEEEQD